MYCGRLLIDRRRDAVELRNPLHHLLDPPSTTFLPAGRRSAVLDDAILARVGRGVFLSSRSDAFRPEPEAVGRLEELI